MARSFNSWPNLRQRIQTYVGTALMQVANSCIQQTKAGPGTRCDKGPHLRRSDQHGHSSSVATDLLPQPWSESQMKERWVPIIGFEGLYEVSDLGHVRSLPRNGTWTKTVRLL